MTSTARTPIQAIAQADTLKIVIPPDTDSKLLWAPQRYVPSIVLTRVSTTPHLELPPPAPIVTEDDTVAEQTIVLTERIGGGYYDYYYASLGQEGRETKDLVVMMRDLSHSVPRQQELVKQHLVAQLVFYSRLASVQGRYVPRCGGLFNHGTLYCLVFEDAGRRLSYQQDFNTKGIKEELLNTVKAINEAGVIVYDGQWSHFNRGTDGVIKMSNFDDTAIDTIEKFTPEYYAKMEEKGVIEIVGETPEESFAWACADGQKYIRSELFDEYEAWP